MLREAIDSLNRIATALEKIAAALTTNAARPAGIVEIHTDKPARVRRRDR